MPDIANEKRIEEGSKNEASTTSAQSEVSKSESAALKSESAALKERARVGFGKLPERPSLEEVFKGLSPEEQIKVLSHYRKEAEIEAQKTQTEFKKLDILTGVAAAKYGELTSPNGGVNSVAKMISSASDFIGLGKGGLEEQHQEEAKKIGEFINEDQKEIQEKILAGKTLKEALDESAKRSVIKAEVIGDLAGLELTGNDLEKEYVKLIKYCRKNHRYKMIKKLFTEHFGKELKDSIDKLGKEKEKELLAKAKKEANKTIHALRKKNELKGKSKEEIESLRAGITKSVYEEEVLKAASKNMDTSGFTGARREFYKECDEALDLRDRALHFSDATWESVKREVMINAPLIMVSGGAASLGRVGIERVGARVFSRAAGEKFGEFVARRGLLGRIGLKAGARVGAGLTEGALFETSFLGLQGQWIGDMPDWGQRIVASSIMLGAIKGAGRLGERAFGKTVVEGGELVRKATRLGKYIDNISNKSVREAAKELLVKGHIEAAAMLTVGAAEKGYYNGSMDGLLKDLGPEVAHTYITLGSLKAGHAGAKAIGNGFRGVQMPEVGEVVNGKGEAEV